MVALSKGMMENGLGLEKLNRFENYYAQSIKKPVIWFLIFIYLF